MSNQMQQNSVSPFGRHRKNLSQSQLSHEEIEWLCNEVIISKKGLRERASGFRSLKEMNVLERQGVDPLF
jgi:hypothetical protein